MHSTVFIYNTMKKKTVFLASKRLKEIACKCQSHQNCKVAKSHCKKSLCTRIARTFVASFCCSNLRQAFRSPWEAFGFPFSSLANNVGLLSWTLSHRPCLAIISRKVVCKSKCSRVCHFLHSVSVRMILVRRVARF